MHQKTGQNYNIKMDNAWFKRGKVKNIWQRK
jgi:hypothetical protein